QGRWGQGAGLRASGAPPARPEGRAHSRARRRARRQRAARGPCARIPRRSRRCVGQAADDERRHADRGGAARPGFPRRHCEIGPDPCPHRRSSRSPRRGAAEPARLSPRVGSGGRGEVRACGRVMLEPEVESRPWDEQLELDAASYGKQVAWLLERSAFYREKLGAVGISGPEEAGGLGDIARLPLTEKSEVKATATADNPIGAHLCVERAEIARIYSTSGTTGTPSYIPLTKTDLDNWVTGSARSYAASGVSPGERIVSTYNAGPFVAGAALDAFERIGLSHIPVGTGNTERLILAIELLDPETVVLTPSYAAYLLEWARDRGKDLRGSSVRRVLVAGEPGGGEPAFRAKLEGGWGAKVTE